MKKQELKLDKKGYEKLIQSLVTAERELHILRFGKKEINPKLRWYDDADVSQNFLKEQNLIKKIKMLEEQIKNARIIEKKQVNDSIDIDDIIKVNILNKSNTHEEMQIKLVGGLGNYDTNPLEVSINSPLGDAIYQKTLGSIVDYRVGNELFSVMIEEKVENYHNLIA